MLMHDQIRIFLEQSILKSDVRAGTKHRYTYTLKRYAEVVGQMEPHDVTWVDVGKFIEQLRTAGLSKGSIQNHLASVSQLHEWLVEERLVNENPVARAKRRLLRGGFKEEDRSRRSPTLGEVGRLLEAAKDPLERAVFLFCAKTASRINEACSLDLSEIVWDGPDRGRCMLKRNRKRTNTAIPLDEETLRTLEALRKEQELRNGLHGPVFLNRDGRRLGTHTARKFLVQAAKRAHLVRDPKDIRDKITPHCLRHFASTILQQRGMDPVYVAELRGDKRSGVLNRYTHPTWEQLRERYLRHVWTVDEALAAARGPQETQLSRMNAGPAPWEKPKPLPMNVERFAAQARFATSNNQAIVAKQPSEARSPDTISMLPPETNQTVRPNAGPAPQGGTRASHEAGNREAHEHPP